MIEQSVSLAFNGVVKVPGYEQLVRFGYTKNRGVYRLHVDATGEWEGLAIRCFWHVPDGKDPASSLVVDGYVAVPASVTAQPGNGCVTFEGSDGTKTVTSADLRYRVSTNSGTEDGTTPEPGTPAWQQFVDAVHTDATAAEQAKTEAQTAAQQAGASAEKAGQALSDTITAKEDALKAIGDKQTTATQAVDTARDKALQQVEASTKAAKTAASEAATSAGNADQSAQEAADSLQELKDGIAAGNFKGEKGDKGDTGPIGPQGPKGDPGPAVALDTTLTHKGEAADAKATGDEIGQLKEDTEQIHKDTVVDYSLELVYITPWQKGFINYRSGAQTSSASTTQARTYKFIKGLESITCDSLFKMVVYAYQDGAYNNFIGALTSNGNYSKTESTVPYLNGTVPLNKDYYYLFSVEYVDGSTFSNYDIAPLYYSAEKGIPIVEYAKILKEDKLDKPANPVIGRFLRVKSISDTGEITLETVDPQTATVRTSMDDVTLAGAKYFLGEQTALSITMPTDAQTGQEIMVVFSSGQTACTLAVDLDDFNFVPKANSMCKIVFLCVAADTWLVDAKEG